MKRVNLGCGSRHHPDWINIDIAARNPQVIAHDLSRGIPLADASCDIVYHSHVLEHIRRDDALPFLRECFRVLQPGGILRVVTPDLERICRLYLEKLNAAANGDTAAASDYDWMMLELYDQTVREKPGGHMLDHLRQQPLPNESFVFERIGGEGRELVSALKKSAGPGTRPRKLRERLLRLFFGEKFARAARIGRYRLTGEVHQWLYDRFSLARLLRGAGFHNPVSRAAHESAIPHWPSFNLDTQPDGSVFKPDSIFMEATKSA